MNHGEPFTIAFGQKCCGKRWTQLADAKPSKAADAAGLLPTPQIPPEMNWQQTLNHNFHDFPTFLESFAAQTVGIWRHFVQRLSINVSARSVDHKQVAKVTHVIFLAYDTFCNVVYQSISNKEAKSTGKVNGSWPGASYCWSSFQIGSKGYLSMHLKTNR